MAALGFVGQNPSSNTMDSFRSCPKKTTDPISLDKWYKYDISMDLMQLRKSLLDEAAI